MASFMCREITMLCSVDRHTRKAKFKVWEREGVSLTDPPRVLLYEGDSWPQAYAAMTGASESIEAQLLPR